MINAAVRPGRITRVRSKRDAKKRRQEIRDERTTMHEEGRFVFFDEPSDDALPLSDAQQVVPQSPAAQTQADLRPPLDSPTPPDTSLGETGELDPAQESDDDWLTLLDLEVKKEADGMLYSPDECYAVPASPAMERLEQLRATTDQQAEERLPPTSLRASADIVAPLAADERPESFDDVDPFATAATPSITPEPSPAPPAAVPAAFQQPVQAAPPTPEPAAFQQPVPAAFQQPVQAAPPAPLPSGFGPGPTQAAPPQHRRADDPPAAPTPEAQADSTEIDKNGAWVPPALRGA